MSHVSGNSVPAFEVTVRVSIGVYAGSMCFGGPTFHCPLRNGELFHARSRDSLNITGLCMVYCSHYLEPDRWCRFSSGCTCLLALRDDDDDLDSRIEYLEPGSKRTLIIGQVYR